MVIGIVNGEHEAILRGTAIYEELLFTRRLVRRKQNFHLLSSDYERNKCMDLNPYAESETKFKTKEKLTLDEKKSKVDEKMIKIDENKEM
ncbi:hypothetical protein QYM36_016964 [Artemia franciscana]|uniref:Uncharacterized protein n=1 Tax=Artemia franciscana TaxID=6661 RepID=A0AA88HC42_ARTSF|nr:hypothetical protein QYM36_016964 [Artemia franciscana]